MRKLLMIVFASSILFSCKKEHSLSNQEPQQRPMSMAVPVNAEGETVLGDELANPYTPDNMRMALDILRSKGEPFPDNFMIEPTHYYVKYMPQTWEDYVELHEDTTQTYFDYPLDREIISQGNRYHDPAVADSMPEYQYTSVKIGTPLNSNIPYEIITPLYIPEQDDQIMNTELEDKLLDQAYILTGNFEDTVKNEPTAARGTSAYRPAGQILIHDNRLNANIGLKGVLVTARRWFTIFRARPDYYGNYQVNGAFKRPCNYSAHFEAPGFNVRQNLINIIAYVNGPKQSGNWNHTINGGYNNFAGDVFRGAYYYHYENIDGLTRPFNPTGKFTSYIAKDATGSGQGINWGIVPIIKIWRYKGSGNAYGDDEIFSTTIHETTHLTHNIVTGLSTIAYASVRTEIRESWAVAVEWYLTGLEYKSRGISNYGDFNYSPTTVSGDPLSYPNQYGYQFWSLSFKDKYTSLFINCIDKYNELNQPFVGRPNGTVNDRVGQFHPGQSGSYSIADLEYLVIRFSVNLATVESNLKAHKPSGVTDNDIDLLMASY